jgi:hypothetical protein
MRTFTHSTDSFQVHVVSLWIDVCFQKVLEAIQNFIPSSRHSDPFGGWHASRVFQIFN